MPYSRLRTREIDIIMGGRKLPPPGWRFGISQEDPGIADPTGGDLAPLGGAAESSNLVVRTVVLPTDAGERRIGGRRRPPIEW